MSGIVGVWNLDGEPLDARVLDRMGTAIGHRGPDSAGCWLDGAAGLACRQLWVTAEEIGEHQPLTGASGSRLVMDGRLDNRDELVSLLGAPRGGSDASLALTAYERWRDDFAGRLNGDFAAAVFDDRSQWLVLARDSMGVRPLYYHYRPGRLFAFASEIKALLVLPGMTAAPDLEGLADRMFLGQRPLDRQHVTCFAGISALPPAHVARVSREGVSIRRYWDFDPAAALRLASFPEYAEAFGQVFAQAVRRRARSAFPVAVSLSGGLDSSSIACQVASDLRSGAAVCPGLSPISYIGPRGSDADEQRYLVDIENTYGLAVSRIPMEPLLGLVRGAERQVGAVEAPFLDYTWGVTEAVHQAARAGGARVLLSGHWGDQMLFSPAYLVDLLRRFRWGDVWRHNREYVRWFGHRGARAWRRRFLLEAVRRHTPRFLVPPLKWIRRRLPGVAREKPWFSSAFRRVALRDANRVATAGNGFRTAHTRSVYLEARSKYHVHCMEWNNKIASGFGLDAAFPYLDRDLIAFLMAVPGDMYCHRGVPRAFLREAMRGILPEPIRARTWKADFTSTVNAGAARDLAHIAATITAGSRAAGLGLLDSARLAAEVARLGAGLTGTDATETWDLADLFGLETWVRVFFSRAT